MPEGVLRGSFATHGKRRMAAKLSLSIGRRVSGGAGVVILLIFTVFGLLVAGLMMYVGWQHNAQGEFHDETGIHWAYWLLLGFSWFIFITGVPYAIGLSVLVWRYIARTRAR